MRIFIHTLEDRYSHHMCSDNSYFFPQTSGNYNSNYAQVFCAQGSHFLWHVWEQGTNQADSNLYSQYQTMRPALENVFDQLVTYARYNNIPVSATMDKATILNNLIDVLQVYDSTTRLDNMVTLMENSGALPLPGYGAAANYSIDEWLLRAGAPVHFAIKAFLIIELLSEIKLLCTVIFSWNIRYVLRKGRRSILS